MAGPRRSDARMREVERRIRRRQPSPDIAREIAEMFGVARRTVYFDIDRIWKKWGAARDSENFEARRLRFLYRLEERLDRAIARKDNRGEDATLEKIGRVEGVYLSAPEDDPLQTDPVAEKVRGMTSQQQRARLAELQAKAAAIAARAPVGGKRKPA